MGGVQSNSMLAIAKIVSCHKHSRFYYVTKHIPKFLKYKPSGNFDSALRLGMQVSDYICDILVLYCLKGACVHIVLMGTAIGGGG
jgi:hypothetical protein